MVAELSSEQTAVILEKVRNDRGLAARVRTLAWRTASDVSQPAQALRRLQTLAEETLPHEPRDTPTTGLSRVVTAGTFLRHHTRLAVREAFATTDDFVRFVETSDNPNQELADALTDDVTIFPWQRSWLAPTQQIKRLDGRALIAALELGSSVSPPLIRFNLPLRRMIDTGVMIRRPCSLDSVLGPNPQWSSSGLASGVEEFVDGDVPLAAVGSVEWVE
ncbi:MAG TPA: hypothetical protein VJ872_17805 [Nocardioides sp.]|nr:hypothetical protein [Nocardioides sp.]